MVTRLVGDSSSLAKAFQSASTEATAAAAAVEGHATQIEGFSTGIKGFASEVTTSVSGMVKSLGLGEEATTKLEESLGPLTQTANEFAGQFDVAAGSVRTLQQRASGFITVGSTLRQNLLTGAEAAKGYWKQLVELGGSLRQSSVAALALKASVAALVTVKVIDWTTGWSKAQRELNVELERGVELNNQLNKRLQDQNAAVLAQAETLEGAQREAFLTEQVEAATAKVEGYEAAVKRANRALIEAALNAESGVVEPAGFKQLQADAAAAEERLKLARQQVDDLNAALAKTPGSESFKGPDEKTLADLAKFEQDLSRQVQTFGMTAEAARLYELRLKGVSDEQLANARGLANMLAAQKAQAKAAEEEAEVLARIDKFHEDERRAAEEAAESQKKFNDSLRDFQSAAAGSAEAAARVAAFREATGRQAKGLSAVPTATPAATPAPAAAANAGLVPGLLKAIADGIAKLVEKPTVEVEELDLE